MIALKGEISSSGQFNEDSGHYVLVLNVGFCRNVDFLN